MEHIIVEHKLDNNDLETLKKYFEIEDIMIFDIETTGLSPKTSKVILIGFIIFHGTSAFVHQLFANHIDEEKEVLSSFIKYTSKVNLLINYNGSSFDIPFVNKRLSAHEVSYRLHSKSSFDLYRICRSSDLNLSNYKLKTLETFLNINREDTISGKESISLYYHYMNTQSEDSKKMVLGHNYEDILHLIPFMNILEHIDPRIIKSHFPKVLVIDNQQFLLSQLKIRKDFIFIDFSLSNPSLYTGKQLTYYENFNCIIKDGYINIEIPIFQVETPNLDKYTFIDSEKLGWVQDFNELDINEKVEFLVSENGYFDYDKVLKISKQIIKIVVSGNI